MQATERTTPWPINKISISLVAAVFLTVVFWAPTPTVFAQEGASSPEMVASESAAQPEPGRGSVRVDPTIKRKVRDHAVLPGVDGAELSATGAPEGSGNRVRKVPPKPVHTVINSNVNPNLIVVKFVEGSGIRLRDGRLTTLSAADLSALDSFNQALSQGNWKRLFERSEHELTQDKQRGEARTGWQLADLNLYFRFELPEDTDDPAAVIDALNALDIVEIAYPEPMPEEAGPVGDIPPTTPDFSGQQDYLDPAPGGIDAAYAWQFDGGAGAGTDFIDVELGWDVCHEDLDVYASDVLAGTNSFSDHGTAVLGEIIGYDNDYGVTGIAHQANARMVSVNGDPGTWPDVANSLNTAAGALSAGDVILIELHAWWGDTGETCYCNCDQHEYIPMEYWQANFDAIQSATANGIIVVEAGGNGGMDLDHSRFLSRFQRTFRDSGAILVGAATGSVPHQPKCWTNYGSRIDVYAWGDSVVTTGYGNAAPNAGDRLWDSGTDDCQDYRDGFGGTSAASPIIVGAALDIQGILSARGDDMLTPAEMRAVLANNGTPHGTPEGPPPSEPIGVMPDLRQAIPVALGNNGNVLFYNPYSNEAERVRSLGYKVTTTTNIADLARSNLQNYDVLWIGITADPATYSGYNTHIRNWVYYDGGGVIVEQPNMIGTVTLFPYGYEVEVDDIFWPSSGSDTVITNGSHPITQGLADTDLTGNYDTVYDVDIGYKWWVLARSATESDVVALLAAYYGSGRFVFNTGNATFGYGSDVYLQQKIDWAANLDARIALVETGMSVADSVIKALNELDRKFDFFDTADFSDIDFSSYDAVVVAMDGGTIEEPSVQNLANYTTGGGNLVMLGGTGLIPFANAVDAHLLEIDETLWGWSSVSVSPHLAVRNTNHPLTDGLPDSYDFTASGATYYMIRSEDAVARVMAENGDGFATLIQKPLGSGHLNWFINSPNANYWTDAADYNILKTIIRNMLAQGVIRIYHSPSSGPRGLGWRYYPYLYNCDDDDMIYQLQSYSGALLDSFANPGGGLGLGLAYDGNTMWHADFGTDTIYQLNPVDMSVLDSFPSPRSDPADLAYGGGYLWAAILQSGPIIKIDRNTGAEVGSVAMPAGSRPFGLTWADGYLYVGDTDNDLIYKIHPNSGNVTSTFPSPGSYPAGLAFDGSYFWVSDFYQDSIYQMSLQSDAADVAITSITFDPPAPVVGENVTVSVTVHNYGAVASPFFWVEFWKEIDHRPDVYEYATVFWSTSLTAGESKVLTSTISYGADGTYSTGAFADSGNTVDEGIYGDNNSYWPLYLTIAPCTDPPAINDISFDTCVSELCDTDISVDATAPCGGNLTYVWAALDGGTIIGSGSDVTFDPPNSGPHPCPYRVNVAVTSDISGLTAEATIGIQVKLAGDANGDGVVNILDKVLVRNAFGTTGPNPADVNCDNVVNILDKVIVRNQFGQSGCACAASLCLGQSCGTYTFDCDPDVPCICFQTTEGYGVCIDNFLCGGQTCSTSADCPSGQLCITDSCCGENLCVPAVCTDGLPSAEPAAGWTGSGQ